MKFILNSSDSNIDMIKRTDFKFSIRNRNRSDENLEIDELVSFIQDGKFKIFVSRATKVSTVFELIEVIDILEAIPRFILEKMP
jgi:hypothetical protein